jgi:hypothetical protein
MHDSTPLARAADELARYLRSVIPAKSPITKHLGTADREIVGYSISSRHIRLHCGLSLLVIDRPRASCPRSGDLAMGTTAAVHPTDQTLQAYGLGKLDESTAELVNRHLESCPDCQRRVAELSSDSFLRRLQGGRGQIETGLVMGSSLAGLSRIAGERASAEPPPASSLPPGLADNPDYEVLRELGQGGMGTVYLAHNRLMRRNEVLQRMSRQPLIKGNLPCCNVLRFCQE